MNLKNAVAVCLISLCSATLVVLIARALDSQAASRLEPQLANIVEELRAMSQAGRHPGGQRRGPRRRGRRRRPVGLLLSRQRAMSHLPIH